MTINEQLRSIAAELASPLSPLAQIKTELADIAALMEAGTLVGAASRNEQPLPDVLRDRLMFNLTQMIDKLGELSADLKVLADDTQTPPPRYQQQPITQPVTLADSFNAFTPYLSEPLVSAEAAAALHMVLAQYPARVSRSLLLEYRLKADQPQVDLSILLDPALDNGREWLAAHGSGVTRDFCAAWADSGSTLHQAVETSWLEIDVPLTADAESETETAPEPSVFFRLREEAALTAHLAHAAIVEGLRLLQPESAALEQIQACLAALPDGASVRWAGVMARAVRSVRLCLDLPKASIQPYLRGLGWQGDDEQLDLLVAGFSKLTDVVIVAIELTPQGLSNTLGFECRYRFNRQPEIEPRWKTLFEMLVRARLCSEEKSTAIQSWNGLFHEPLRIEGKPQVMVRNLSHVKIGYQPGVAVTAKAYVSCNMRDFRIAR